MLETLHTADFAEPMEGSAKLSDGRQLSYAEYGDRGGSPVFHFHGHPGSRLEAGILHEPAAEVGVRLIGVDRPGMGYSDSQAGRRVLDWPSDLVELADRLDIDRFAVQGISGGGPYAAAAAYAIPDRLTAVGILSGAGPTGLGASDGELSVNKLQRRLSRYSPFLLDVAFGSMARSIRSSMEKDGPVALTRAALGGLPSVDRAALAEPLLARRYGVALHEAFRQGGKGAAWDAKLLSRHWGFDLARINHPKVHVWHGALDRNVSIATGRAVVGAIPGAHGHLYEEEGHISVAMRHAHEILDEMRG